jgi:fructose-bisphosphate aldolase, class I
MSSFLSEYSQKQFRLGRLFRKGTMRTFMVALDHGQGGLHKGLDRPAELMKSLVAADPDAVLMGPGLMRRFRHLFAFRGAPALILSLDMFLDGTLPKEDVEGMETHRFTTSVEEAVRLGADAVKILMIWGRESVDVQGDNFQNITRVCEESQKWNLPVIVEPTLWGPRAKGLSSEEKKRVILDIARIGFELGGDMIKIEAPPEIVPELVSAVPVPITLLGGAPKGSMDEYLRGLQKSIAAGVVGAVVGRRVWQAEDIAGTAAHFKEAIYQA